MTIRAFVDPGVAKLHAVAVFSHHELTDVYFTAELEAFEYDEVYVEMPNKVYATRGNVESIIKLARAGERCVRHYANPHYLTPNEWKGCTRKELHNSRVFGALQPYERELLLGCYKGAPKDIDTLEQRIKQRVTQSWKSKVAEWKMGDALDSVGMGLKKLGRINKKGEHRK